MNDDLHTLATEARTIRLAATRLQAHARERLTAAALHEQADKLSNAELVSVRRDLGTIRRAIDVLIERFGKADR